VQEGSGRFRKVQEGSGRFRKVQEGAGRCRSWRRIYVDRRPARSVEYGYRQRSLFPMAAPHTGAGPVPKSIILAGLDVHKETTTIERRIGRKKANEHRSRRFQTLLANRRGAAKVNDGGFARSRRRNSREIDVSSRTDQRAFPCESWRAGEIESHPRSGRNGGRIAHRPPRRRNKSPLLPFTPLPVMRPAGRIGFFQRIESG
jgi:hypothetical protein